VTRKLIFVVGTGRSGTNWMGGILGTHPGIRSFVEVRPVFDLVTAAAVGTGEREELLPDIFDEYDRLYEQASPLHFADKTHPALWIAEEIRARYGGRSVFIGMVRDVHPTVASMLEHQGVRRWCEEWEKYPVPNPFLGITEENLSWYRSASLSQRCVARWASHRQEIERLEKTMNGGLLPIRYEDLVLHPQSTLERLRVFLELDLAFPPARPRHESLDAWASRLPERDRRDIEAAAATISALRAP
jgi:hypothetical protein